MLTLFGLPRRRQLAFASNKLGCATPPPIALTQSPLDFIAGCAELVDRSAHPTGKLRQLLRAKQQQYNEEDYHHVRSHEIENTTDHWIHKSFISA